MRRCTARTAARAYEQTLDPARRKQFGQYFTGIPLGKLLAHLALRPETRTVLDPMAGHGDLLDATREAAAERAIPVARLDGIEIDTTTADVCRGRLAALVPQTSGPDWSILGADAFDPATASALPVRGYDLVITNPPYVRYQTRNGDDAAAIGPRSGLQQILEGHYGGADSEIWKVLVRNYSGLSDLSVPAWILAGLLVRPGGRLALVAPATWRSRNYADVIRYMLLRFFRLETIVADSQPGWFSDALVRTHLIIARRLSIPQTRPRLNRRTRWADARWVHVTQDASDGHSLVGAAFAGAHPEARFAASVYAGATDSPRGIDLKTFELRHEWATLDARLRRTSWYPSLEGDGERGSPVSAARQPSRPALPEAVRDLLPPSADTTVLIPLEKAGLGIGQGLRTGCNAFFYVTACSTVRKASVQVKASHPLGGTEFTVPSAALHPALRRQAEMKLVERGVVPDDRVLDLRGWVLPEDSSSVEDACRAYKRHRTNPPRVMPTALAAFVRRASTVSTDRSQDKRLIPELSAVRTNVRRPNREGVIPRFWYMIPDFAPRHLPAAFVPRVNHGTPWIERNMDPPLLIDANFSTFWTPDDSWTRFGLKALLNSIWCRCFMEASGTPLGGGALKLEATHLRRLLVPRLTTEARSALNAAGRNLTRDSHDVQEYINRIVLQALVPEPMSEPSMLELEARLMTRTRDLRAGRQRVAS